MYLNINITQHTNTRIHSHTLHRRFYYHHFLLGMLDLVVMKISSTFHVIN